ncbi:hypothetical protein FGM00_08425 [Aggregatimonas sangjinii]|uniref:Aerotolerance regulator N-terminal domain-containing protein n=1 Tax=Aggregatimonas sangjinii TaxID=2583587 RepID=A0A5B7SSY4_9FLAO|nr:BatA domain-containing protein [Aggregatimonas sangjinii]QCX00128.1 hypothetical protein FGM00_08425 [Aggregatimonas sangjinii]
MQFKHPELLWGLLLLLIPIIIHLFQLRRFKKTPFTNVKFLKKVVSESRRSNTLKKWLLLAARMLLLACLVIAFAQPFLAGKTALLEKETVIYLDDSFSMQAKAVDGTLFENAVQSLVKSLPETKKISLFTNKEVFRNVTLPEIRNDLLALKTTAEQLRLDEVRLKANTFFSSDTGTDKNLILISDFQQRFASHALDSTNNFKTFLVRLAPESTANVSLDSVYLQNDGENLELTVLLNTNGETESTPVSLFNGGQLIAKTAAVFDDTEKTSINFTLPKNETIKGKLQITDAGLQYDNHLYFSLNKKDNIKVLSIGSESDDYLQRIFTKDEFDYKNTTLKSLDYSQLEEQNLIVLNELPSIPTAMTTSLRSFTENGGSLVILPSNAMDVLSYNTFTGNYFSTAYGYKMTDGRNITKINFSHPLYQDVFEQKVTNFQYPNVSSYFTLKTNAPALLSFQDDQPFLVGADDVYFFTAPLSNQNSNYKNSPLIVPTFYNMGKSSLQLPELYTVLGRNATIDIATALADDRVVKAVKGEYEFIPQQRSFSNRVQLGFDQNPEEDGIYEIKNGDNTIQDISFNYQREESELVYASSIGSDNTVETNSIPALFESIEKDNSINELWKWFVILALLFMVLELLIQKYL